MLPNIYIGLETKDREYALRYLSRNHVTVRLSDEVGLTKTLVMKKLAIVQFTGTLTAGE